MPLDERIGWFLLGVVIGYVVRTIRDIKKEVREVEEIVSREKNQRGFMRNAFVADFAVLLVIAMCVYASFSTQITNNRLEAAIEDIQQAEKDAEENRDRISRVAVCSQEYLARTIEALNQRTTYTQDQADANVALNRAQRDFLVILSRVPPPTDADAKIALSNYVARLREYTAAYDKNKDKTETYAYPASEDLDRCLSKARS